MFEDTTRIQHLRARSERLFVHRIRIRDARSSSVRARSISWTARPGSCIGRPLFAKFMMSMPWWQTEVQTLQEMHFDFSGKIRKREKRA